MRHSLTESASVGKRRALVWPRVTSQRPGSPSFAGPPLCLSSRRSACLPALPGLGRPHAPEATPAPPLPSWARHATTKGRGKGRGMGTPLPECTDTLTVAFPECPYRSPNFPLGKRLAGSLSVCLDFYQAGSLSFLDCKMGTSSASVWSGDKRAAK